MSASQHQVASQRATSKMRRRNQRRAPASAASSEVSSEVPSASQNRAPNRALRSARPRPNRCKRPRQSEAHKGQNPLFSRAWSRSAADSAPLKMAKVAQTAKTGKIGKSRSQSAGPSAFFAAAAESSTEFCSYSAYLIKKGLRWGYRRVLPPVAGVAACAFLAWGSATLVQEVHDAESFRVAHLDWTPSPHVDETRLHRLLQLQDRPSIFDIDLGHLRKRLESEPWIAKASVVRVLPDTLRVDIVEHEAVAILVDRGAWLLNAEGEPFKPAEAEDLAADLRADPSPGAKVGGQSKKRLPLITGFDGQDQELRSKRQERIATAINALEIYRQSPDRPPVEELHVGLAGDLDLFVRDLATRLHLSRSDLHGGLSRFDALWKAASHRFLARNALSSQDPQWSAVFLDAPSPPGDHSRVVVRYAHADAAAPQIAWP